MFKIWIQFSCKPERKTKYKKPIARFAYRRSYIVSLASYADRFGRCVHVLVRLVSIPHPVPPRACRQPPGMFSFESAISTGWNIHRVRSKAPLLHRVRTILCVLWKTRRCRRLSLEWVRFCRVCVCVFLEEQCYSVPLLSCCLTVLVDVASPRSIATYIQRKNGQIS